MLICTRCLQFARNYFRNMGERRFSESANWKSFMIVGLGNPDLHKTRHNVGMRAVDALAASLDVRWVRQRALLSMVATAPLPDAAIELILVKPKVMMNVNGKSVQRAAEHYDVQPNSIYLLHDELDKRVGMVRMKEGGSARGHNGVRSAINHLKTDVMPRLLIGVDRPTSKNDVADYLLEHFSREELPTIDNSIKDGLERLLRHIQTSSGCESDLISLVMKDKSSDNNSGESSS